jgi:hypothetical protein
MGTDVPTPEVTATRDGARASIHYRFATLGGEPRRRPATLLLSVARDGAPDDAAARRVRVRRRHGVASLRLPPAGDGPYTVSASAFTRHGSRSAVVRAPLR